MSYPTLDTISVFKEMLRRDGVEDIIEKLIIKNTDTRLFPILGYFKATLTHLMEDGLYDEIDGYSTGFLTCLDLFRRQIESNKVKFSDLEIQIENMCGWTEFLEKEALEIKTELNELRRQNKELQGMLSVQKNGDIPNTPGV